VVLPFAVGGLPLEAFLVEVVHPFGETYQVVVAYQAVEAFQVEEDRCSFEGSQDPCWDFEAFLALAAVQAWPVAGTFLAATSAAYPPLATVLASLGASQAATLVETSEAYLPSVASAVVLASVEAFLVLAACLA